MLGLLWLFLGCYLTAYTDRSGTIHTMYGCLLATLLQATSFQSRLSQPWNGYERERLVSLSNRSNLRRNTVTSTDAIEDNYSYTAFGYYLTSLRNLVSAQKYITYPTYIKRYFVPAAEYSIFFATVSLHTLS